MLCTHKKTAVYTIFSQPIKFKLGTQTFIQHTLCQQNILPVYTVLIHCLHSDSDCILSYLVYESNEPELSLLSLEPESNYQNDMKIHFTL